MGGVPTDPFGDDIENGTRGFTPRALGFNERARLSIFLRGDYAYDDQMALFVPSLVFRDIVFVWDHLYTHSVLFKKQGILGLCAQ